MIVGLLAGILIVAAGIVALCEVVTVRVIGLVMAPAKDISTSEWFSLASLREAGRDYLTVLAGVTGWAIFGTTLAVIFRSVPLALGRRVRVGGSVREHRRRLVEHGVSSVPRSGAGLADPRRHHRPRHGPSRRDCARLHRHLCGRVSRARRAARRHVLIRAPSPPRRLGTRGLIETSSAQSRGASD